MSLSTMKRKTLNGNPRLAPISGENNGTFGFSLNGTRRGNYIGRDNLAPTAMTGTPQLISSTTSKPTGPGIYGHSSSVCTNDPTVVKTTVMNTKGRLSKKLNGIQRIAPVAPIRLKNTTNCSVPSECGCQYGDIVEPAYSIDTQYWPCKDQEINCIGPQATNWVKNPTVPNGNQGDYIKRVVQVNGRRNSKGICNSTKSYNGIIGVLDINGFNALINNSKGCSINTHTIPSKEFEQLVEEQSILPMSNICSKINVNTPNKPILNALLIFLFKYLVLLGIIP